MKEVITESKGQQPKATSIKIIIIMKMRIFLIGNLFFCFSLNGQRDTIYLQDTILNSFCRFSLEVDSTIIKKGDKYEYFSISSSGLIPTLQNHKDLFIRIKTTQNDKTIMQYFSENDISGWEMALDNNAEYKFVFIDSIDSAKIFYGNFKVEHSNGRLSFNTKKALFGHILLLDFPIKFIIRPFIIPKSNIDVIKVLSQKDTIIETLEFEEPFELLKKHYKLVDLNLITKSITIDTVSLQESQFGYKKDKMLSNFKELKNQLHKKIRFDRALNDPEYYMFYFWGEWCQPCLKKIDYNKSLFSKIDSFKVNIINVALSMTEESERKTIELIRENQIDGFHIIENQKSLKDGLIQKLNVSTYPSYILLDKDGKIIYRSDGIEKTTIEEFLMKMKLYSTTK